MSFKYEFERLMIVLDRVWLRGWIFNENSTLTVTKLQLISADNLTFDIPYGKDSPDIVLKYGESYSKVRFDHKFDLPESLANNHPNIHNGYLRVHLSDGTQHDIQNYYQSSANIDPKNIQGRFIEMNRKLPQGNLLELGSSGSTGTFTKTHMLPSGWTYTGFDIRAGENVDVIGDAHNLSQYLPRNHFDAIVSMSVFEHLFMPWKVAVELNKVLKIGGIGYILCHQVWPIHCEPWDYYRFSEHAWLSIFNKYSGFEIIDVSMSLPANLCSYVNTPGTDHNIKFSCYQASMVLFRKVYETQLEWPVNTKEIISTMYPDHP